MTIRLFAALFVLVAAGPAQDTAKAGRVKVEVSVVEVPVKLAVSVGL